MKKVTQCKIVSVEYVNQPEAAQKWFDLYVNLILKEMGKGQVEDNQGGFMNEDGGILS